MRALRCAWWGRVAAEMRVGKGVLGGGGSGSGGNPGLETGCCGRWEMDTGGDGGGGGLGLELAVVIGGRSGWGVAEDEGEGEGKEVCGLGGLWLMSTVGWVIGLRWAPGKEGRVG